MRSALAAALALLALAASGCGGGGKSAATSTALPAQPYRGAYLQPPLRAADFALRDQDGKLVRLSGFRGGWVVVTFLYTRCPDVCPLIANQLNTALRRLGPAANLHVLAVSVDPRHDTRAAVRRYVVQHRLVPRFRFLIGARAQLAPVWRAYHVAASPDGSVVDHSAFELLVDPRGRGRIFWDAQVKAGDVVHDLRMLERAA